MRRKCKTAKRPEFKRFFATYTLHHNTNKKRILEADFMLHIRPFWTNCDVGRGSQILYLHLLFQQCKMLLRSRSDLALKRSEMSEKKVFSLISIKQSPDNVRSNAMDPLNLWFYYLAF